MIAILLKLLPLKDWCYLGAILAILAGGAYWHHETYEAGVKAAVAAQKLQGAKDRATLEAKATTAEKSSEQANAALQHYRDSTPVAPVRLCISPSPRVQAAPAQPERSAATSGAGSVQPVPPGDNRGGPGTAGPDISGLLEALAARADQVNIQAHELQERQQ